MLRYCLAAALLVSIQAHAMDLYRIGSRIVAIRRASWPNSPARRS